MRDLLDTALGEQRLSPGTACDVAGCLTFLDQGMFGRVARAGLAALRERRLPIKEPKLIRKVMPKSSHPHYPGSVAGTPCPASARLRCQQTAPREGSGGFLLIERKGDRLAAVVPITEAVIDLWPNSDKCIAQLELFMLLQAVPTGTWHIDDTVT